MMDVPEKISVMLLQETTAYRCPDYLSCPPTIRSNFDHETPSESLQIQAEWREKLCDWAVKVVDYFDMDREIVSVCVSYLDRYVAQRLVSKRVFQLVAMTSLYIATKFYDPRKLCITSLVALSNGNFLGRDLLEMEREILYTLSWRMNPPTPVCCVRHLLLLLPPTLISTSTKRYIRQYSEFFTELSVCDYYFVTLRPSCIAVAAVLNAMDQVSERSLSPQARQWFLSFAAAAGIDVTFQEEVLDCRSRLQMLYENYRTQENAGVDAFSVSSDEEDDQSLTRIDTVSPICVSEIGQFGRNVSKSFGR